jgi:hypothetical protein
MKNSSKKNKEPRKNVFLRVSVNIAIEENISYMIIKLNKDIEEYAGAAGVGTLIMLLYELESTGELPLNLRYLSRKLGIAKDLLDRVINDFDLFKIEDDYIYPVIDICGYNNRKKWFGTPYLSIPDFIITDKKVSNMITRLEVDYGCRVGYGVAGLGAYIMILCQLANCQGHRSKKLPETLSYNINFPANLVNILLNDFGLFARAEDGSLFSEMLSLSLSEKMKKNAISRVRSIAGKKGGLAKGSRSKGVKNKGDAEEAK